MKLVSMVGEGDSSWNKLNLVDSSESVWSELPEDLTITILARLPIPRLLQARAVCKRWEALIRSPAFLKLCSGIPPRLPWYLGFQGFRHEQGWAYDPALSSWYNLDFSFLPGLGRCAAAAGGLLCFCQDNVQGNALYVCNPMTKVWRPLPQFPGCVKQVFMSVDSAAANTYTVVVIVQDESRGRAGGAVSVLLYARNEQRWRETSAPACHPQLNVVDAALCGGVLYCLNRCLTRDWQFIKSYDLRKDVWSDLSIPMPNAFRSYDLMQMTYLVQHDDKLLLVEKVITSPDISSNVKSNGKSNGTSNGTSNGIKSSVGIYELDLVGREWRGVGSLEKTTLCIGSFSSRAVRCQGGGGGDKLIYFTNHGSAVNVYDVNRGLWHRLPEFPRQKMVILRKPRCNLGVVIPFKGLWFEPRLDSAV